MITVIQHNKNEWARMAQAAYAAGRNDVGHRYSAAAAAPVGTAFTCSQYDALQSAYRAWLVFGTWPSSDALDGQRYRLLEG